MNQEQSIDVDELNQSIVEHVSNALNSFCFGEYKETTVYPVAITKVTIESSGIKKRYNLRIRQNKNSMGMLKTVDVSVQLIDK